MGEISVLRLKHYIRLSWNQIKVMELNQSTIHIDPSSSSQISMGDDSMVTHTVWCLVYQYGWTKRGTYWDKESMGETYFWHRCRMSRTWTDNLTVDDPMSYQWNEAVPSSLLKWTLHAWDNSYYTATVQTHQSSLSQSNFQQCFLINDFNKRMELHVSVRVMCHALGQGNEAIHGVKVPPVTEVLSLWEA